MVQLFPLLRPSFFPCRAGRKEGFVSKFNLGRLDRRHRKIPPALFNSQNLNEKLGTTMSVSETINFAQYDVLGFDMDNTLARYKLVPFFNVSDAVGKCRTTS